MKARRLQFGYLKTINSLDEKSFPLLIRTVSMKEMLVIFPSSIIGMMLFIKGQILPAIIPLMLAFYVIMYNERSVPFYYQFIAFIMDFVVASQKPKGKKEKVKKESKPIMNVEKMIDMVKELGLTLGSAVALGVGLYLLNVVVYSPKPNLIAVVVLAIIVGLSLANLLSRAIRTTRLASKR